MTSEIPSIGPDTVFPTRTCSLSARDQERVHAHSGFAVDGTHADPVLLANRAFHAIGEAIETHHVGVGPVITNQVITVATLEPIGVEARAEGRVTRHEETPRGSLFTAVFSVRGPSGRELVELRVTILLIDPTKPAPPRKPQSRDNAPAPTGASLGTFSFSPDAARAFDLEYAGRSLHSSMEIANGAGFPKPIVAGNQVFDMLWNRYVKDRFELPVTLDFTLRRPIFWDEEIRFAQADDSTIDVLNAAGKLAISCNVEGTRR